MGKRLTYEQRVRRKVSTAWLFNGMYGIAIISCKGAAATQIGVTCTRPRDAWRSAWRNLKEKKRG